VVGAAALVAAFVASVAHADQAFTDPLGDGQTAADVTGVAVASDNHGNISFHITWAGGQLLPKGDVLRLAIDTDRNPLTGGEEGEEVAIELDGDPSYAAFGSWFDGRWDGAQIDYDWIARSARVRFRPGEIDVSINNADLNHSIAFDFWVYSDRMDGDDVVGEDLVPDGSAVYTHALAAPVRAQKAAVRLTTGRAQATPASPRAGRRFATPSAWEAPTPGRCARRRCAARSTPAPASYAPRVASPAAWRTAA
jgi:hypothetical protein